jgi:pilus assembly protein CpaF
MVLMADDVALPIEAIDKQIASGIDIFIHLSRINKSQRKLMEVNEVLGYENGEVKLGKLFIYESKEGKDVWRKVGALKHTEKLENYFNENSMDTRSE